MALIDAFLKQMVKIKPYIRTAGGEPVYGREETRKCRLERGCNLQATYKDPDGQIDQILANARMFCRGEPIPDRSVVSFEGREYTVIKCFVASGFRDDHLEVYLE